MMISIARSSFWSLLVVGALTFGVIAQQPAAPDTRIVAEVGGRRILASDLRARIVAERKQAVAENRLDGFGTKAASTALDQLVDVKLFAAAARAEGLLDRADVKHAIDTLVDDLLAQTLVAERAAALPIGAEALRLYYDANPREFELPHRVHGRHIVVKTEAEATALLGQVRRSGDFAALAAANNIDSTRGAGGDLGLVARGVMVEPFDRALFSLKVGEVSPVIRTPQGFHIVKVERIEPGARKPFTTVVAEIREKLLRANVQTWKASLAKIHPVTVHDQVLRSLR